MKRNYIKYVPTSYLHFPKTELTASISDYRSEVYSLPLFIYSSLFLSHNIRRDVNVFLVLSSDSYQVIQISSNELRNMRPDFRSIIFILSKAIKLARERQVNNSYFHWSGVRIFNSLKDFKDALTGFSLIIVRYECQTPHLTSLPKDNWRYLIQIGASPSVKFRLEAYFPLRGVLPFPPFFDICFAPSVLNIELDRSQIFDQTVDPTIV